MDRKQSWYERMVDTLDDIDKYVRNNEKELRAKYGNEVLVITENNGEILVYDHDKDESGLGKRVFESGIMERKAVIINTIERIINPVNFIGPIGVEA